jgi:hypothetical protein
VTPASAGAALAAPAGVARAKPGRPRPVLRIDFFTDYPGADMSVDIEVSDQDRFASLNEEFARQTARVKE